MLILLPLVHAAEWLNTMSYNPALSNSSSLPSSVINRQPRFEQFLHHLKEVDFIAATFPDWLVPAWLRHLDSIEEPKEEPVVELNDSDFAKHLIGLCNSEIRMAKKYAEVAPKIRNHLKVMAKKITATIKYGRENIVNSEDLDDWYNGLKGFAMRLAKNACMFPAWLDAANNFSAAAAIEVSSLVHLMPANRFSSVSVQFPQSTRITYSGIMNTPLSVRDQLRYAANLAWMLAMGILAIPEEGAAKPIRQAINLLGEIWLSNGLKGKELDSFVTMIPVGHRFAVSTVSSSNHAAILDMIKSEDGYVYGIKYAPTELTHSHTLAFCLAIRKLPNLLEFLNGPYSMYNDIGGNGLMWAKVSLPWYRRAKISNPLAMVRQFALSWPIGDRLRLGIIYKHCLIFKRVKKDDTPVRGFEEVNFLMELIDQTSVEDARKLVEMIKKMNCPVPAEGDEVATIGRELIDAIRRRLIARVD